MENIKNIPEKKFRAGAISVTVWNNEGRSKEGMPITYRTVRVERRYKDKNGDWQSANSLRLNDIPKAVVALCSAYGYLVSPDGDNVEERV